MTISDTHPDAARRRRNQPDRSARCNWKAGAVIDDVRIAVQRQQIVARIGTTWRVPHVTGDLHITTADRPPHPGWWTQPGRVRLIDTTRLVRGGYQCYGCRGPLAQLACPRRKALGSRFPLISIRPGRRTSRRWPR